MSYPPANRVQGGIGNPYDPHYPTPRHGFNSTTSDSAAIRHGRSRVNLGMPLDPHLVGYPSQANSDVSEPITAFFITKELVARRQDHPAMEGPYLARTAADPSLHIWSNRDGRYIAHPGLHEMLDSEALVQWIAAMDRQDRQGTGKPVHDPIISMKPGILPNMTTGTGSYNPSATGNMGVLSDKGIAAAEQKLRLYSGRYSSFYTPEQEALYF